jgi:hypothetical protein
MMAPLKLFLLAVVSAGVATAFAPSSSSLALRTAASLPAPASTQLFESFGLGLGEDTYENQPDLLKGEQEYKQYVNRITEDNMLNRKVGWMCVESPSRSL